MVELCQCESGISNSTLSEIKSSKVEHGALERGVTQREAAILLSCKLGIIMHILT